jgi:hypothetical protein
MRAQKLNDDEKAVEGSQRMTALIDAVKLITTQPGVAPKRYVQKPKRDMSPTDRDVSVSALIDAVKMAHAPRSSSENVNGRDAHNVQVGRNADDSFCIERSCQRMTVLTKAVKLVTSQPGVGPKRYARKASVGLRAEDTTSSMSVLIDAVRMSMRKPQAESKLTKKQDVPCI